jgi:hypothetical protein
MSDKNFLITKYNLDEIETIMEEKLNNFIIDTFGKDVVDNIKTKAEYVEYMDEDMKCFKDELRCELWLEITFPQYSYLIKEHGIHNESVGMILEFKGSQPFYIDGRFESRNVFEWIQGMPIQKCEKIYGINKDELYDRFNEYILDC